MSRSSADLTPKKATQLTEAYELGKLLALAGHAVLTGGYIGTMEAVSGARTKPAGTSSA